MADQAQGLRALVDQARRDPSGTSFPPDSFPLSDSAAARADAHPDVLNPEQQTRALRAVEPSREYARPVGRMETAVAAVDARLRAPHDRAVSPDAPPLRRADGLDVAICDSSLSASRRVARVVAITSGKGGVGKTNFCSNLALTLAARGQRVIIVDADLGLANVHVVLGVAPRFHLEHVMRGEKSLTDVLYPGPGGVQIIGGGSGLTDMANLDEERRQRFIRSLSELDSLADVVLLDTGAGLSHNVLAFLCAVEEVIVITTPEPTAITDAYATIKVLSQENPRAQQWLVVNMAQSDTEAQAVAQRLQNIAQRFLQRDLNCLGVLPHDMAVPRAVRAQQPFSLLLPTSPAALAVAQIAERLGYEKAKPGTTAGVSGLLNRMQRFFGLRTPTG